MGNLLRKGCLVCCCLFLNACAKTQSSNNSDPYECFNRGMYQLNKHVDKAIVKPVATIYDVLVPQPIKNGVQNAYQNLNEVPTAINSLLQLKGQQLAQTCARFLTNTTIGLIGLFDVASKLGIPKYNEDVGDTLAFYGYKDSSYLVLPLLGPSTVRDAFGKAGTYYMSVLTYRPKQKDGRHGLLFGQVISTRARLLKAESVGQASAVDEYIFFREAYLQNKNAAINKTTTQDENQSLDHEQAPE